MGLRVGFTTIGFHTDLGASTYYRAYGTGVRWVDARPSVAEPPPRASLWYLPGMFRYIPGIC
jgi:hypothetical protein